MSRHRNIVFSASRTRRTFAAALRPVGVASAAAITTSSIYLGLLSIAAIVSERRARESARSGPVEARGGHAEFLVVIPAHNEESVIEATVRALVGQRYPRESFSVHVVADNCHDATAGVARRAGATVHVRDDVDDPGKGAALNWLYGRIGLEGSDGVVVVDADTVADEGFLAALNRAFATGADVLQGDYGVLDPGRSTAVALRYAALACRHRLRPLGRSALGCSSGLYGNGMAFRTSVIVDRTWSGHLVEDAQFQLDLLLDGVAVTYVPDARIAAEMPATMEASLTQHQRWELGRSQLIRAYVPSLLGCAVRPEHGLKRRVYVDAVVDLLLPPLSMVTATTFVGVVANVGAHWLVPRKLTATSMLLSGAGAIALAGHVAAGLRSAGAPRSVWISLASAPRLVVWKLVLLFGIARRPGEVSWTRTERNEGSSGDFVSVEAAS